MAGHRTRSRARGFDPVDPVLPIVAVDLPYDLLAELRETGWLISRTRAGEGRVVRMSHVTRPMLREFLSDVDRLA